jgi:hypothetical protein
MDWRGRLLTSDTLSEAGVDWMRKMAEGTPGEVGIVLLVANTRSGENVMVASANLPREAVRSIVKNLKVDVPLRAAGGRG